ncbi:MAG: single-stranded-DNA-specific exonuclease RecJ [Alphaproteobacteria bacterium]|nr:single-stranded-DNA-specific exonuclease RecJ [Alphaproteobacteria bacterium]
MAEAFLGVESSLSGKRWTLRDGDDRTALALSQRLSLPEIVGRILASRDVTLEDAENFLEPTLRDLLPDPSHLLDMDVAVERIVDAVITGEKIAIFGDYDVDGATSSALLRKLLTAIGVEVIAYIPDRMKEGYGPNGDALRNLKIQGASLVVTVDCGTSSHDAFEVAAEINLDVIVVDHHVAEPALPKALAIINPNRLDETSPHGKLAAVGVAFLLAVAINRALRARGWFNQSRKEPDLRRWLDIVALGTVCDVVPLVGVNRALVVQGLKVMAHRENPGLAALAEVSGVTDKPTAYHLGYVMGPRVNAGGRVGESALGSLLLSTDSYEEAYVAAEKLNGYNLERREIEVRVQEEAVQQVEADGGKTESLIFVVGEGWHPGVVGIVASRLKDRYGVPACVLALSDGMATGSGRSIKGIDLGTAVLAANQAGILKKGGGHAMAAGFSLEKGQLETFKAFLSERFTKQIKADNIVPTLSFDGAVSTKGATVDLINQIDQVGPFGAGNPEPRFAISNAEVVYAKAVGKDQNHLSCTLSSPEGGRLKAIAFGGVDTAYGLEMLNNREARFHVSGKLRTNEWQGTTSAQLSIDDAAKV